MQDKYEIVRSKGDLEAIAEERDCGLLYPRDDEVFLDLDDKTSQDRYYEGLRFINDLLPKLILSTKEQPSRSGGNKIHVILKLNQPIMPELRLALQAALGSDQKREILNISRFIICGDPQDCLMPPKAKAEKEPVVL